MTARPNITPARLVASEPPYQAPGRLLVTKRYYEVPLDHSDPGGESLTLYVQYIERFEVAKPGCSPKERPHLFFLQGGPGFGCDASTGVPWLQFMLDKGYNVVLMDQRGNGLSQPVDARIISKTGKDAARLAERLSHFRADNIVRDSEALRKTILGGASTYTKWSLMGQSFGGFCAITYLSFHPEGVEEVFITAGLAPIHHTASETYKKLGEKLKELNQRYYEKFPGDVDMVHRIAEYLSKNKAASRGGGHLSVDRFRSLGMLLGGGNGFVRLHDLISRMASEIKIFGEMSHATIDAFDSAAAFESDPMYAVFHEMIYNNGPVAANWAADAYLSSEPEFAKHSTSSIKPLYFFGEMITKSMFDDFVELRPFRPAMEILAKKADWPRLYDFEQLAKNKVPVYATAFVDDLFVDLDYARETANSIKNCKIFITNTMHHGAVREATEAVLGALFKLRDDVMD